MSVVNIKFPTPFDEIQENLVVNKTPKQWISVTLQPKTPVYILKGYELFEATVSRDLSKKFTPYLTKKEITTEAWELCDKSPFNNTFMIDMNTVFRSQQLLVLKFEGYTIITDKEFVHYNTSSELRTHKFQVTKDRYLYIEYKNTNVQDIEIFCQAYDMFESYKDNNSSNNSYIKTMYKNRITKCLLKGKHGRVIETII